MPPTDPIIEEIHAIREALAKESGYDAEKIAEQNEGEEGPDDAFEAPPPALEFEVFADGGAALDLRDGVFNGTGERSGRQGKNSYFELPESEAGMMLIRMTPVKMAQIKAIGILYFELRISCLLENGNLTGTEIFEPII